MKPVAVSSSSALLAIRNLSVTFSSHSGSVKALHDVSFSLNSGELLAIVGESGCGKSTAALAIMGLLNNATITGSIMFKHQELLGLRLAEMQLLRRRQLAIVFQDTAATLNPVFTIGSQLAEGLRLQQNLRGKRLQQGVIELLEEVELPDAASLRRCYPHQLSGGMRQRVLLAIALAQRPQLLIADEPTAALDLLAKAELTKLLRKAISKERAMLLISHDLTLVNELADQVLILYAGEVLEIATTEQLFNRPLHPYSQGLLACQPSLATYQQPLTFIPGQVSHARVATYLCPFAQRCPLRLPICQTEALSLRAIEPRRMVRCWRAGEIAFPLPTKRRR